MSNKTKDIMLDIKRIEMQSNHTIRLLEKLRISNARILQLIYEQKKMPISDTLALNIVDIIGEHKLIGSITFHAHAERLLSHGKRELQDLIDMAEGRPVNTLE